mgnify:CR=1 FL=1|tara:strand:+ start:426 stop:1598 length:1173 start_codon:yes stop_codon:yes gene_type:complete
MGINKILVFFIAFFIVAGISFASQTESTNYKISTGVVSSGGGLVNSSSYKNYVATGIIAGVMNSSVYHNWLGFFYTWLLADGEQCRLSTQCQGNFCCEYRCASSGCPVAAPAASGGGGEGTGGGGGGFFVARGEKDYTVNPNNVKVKLVLGENAEKTLVVENTGRTNVTISLDVETVEQYLSLSEKSFNLKIDESVRITLDFIGRNVGSFVGRITAIAEDIIKSVPIIVEVITELVLFDVKLDIPFEYSEVEPGDELKIQITLLNVGAPEKVDVFATYFIKDLSGNIIYEETETFAVEKQISYPKTFKIHESTVPESYVAIAEIRYADSFAVSSQLFRVVEKKEFVATELITKNTSLMVLLGLIIISVISFLGYKLASITKRKGKKKKGK